MRKNTEKVKVNFLIHSALSSMNERNMENQRIILKITFINLSVSLDPETMSNSEPTGTTMSKSKGTDRKRISLGLEEEYHPYRKRLK